MMIVFPDPKQDVMQIASELMSDCMGVPIGDGSYSVDPELMENHGRLCLLQSGCCLIASLSPTKALEGVE